MQKVIYIDKEKKDIIKPVLKAFYNWDNKDEKIKTKDTINLLSAFLLNLKFAFKKECFAHEEEVRAAMYLTESNECKEKYPIKHFAKSSFIIPCIFVDIKDKSNLREIVIGPLAEKELSKSTVYDLLERRGYKIIPDNIHNSKVPIRF